MNVEGALVRDPGVAAFHMAMGAARLRDAVMDLMRARMSLVRVSWLDPPMAEFFVMYSEVLAAIWDAVDAAVDLHDLVEGALS